jgi:DUF4097 and DUF4098 domain-containing protein YvlB
MNTRFQLATLIFAASMAAVAQNPDSRLYRSGNEWIQEINGSMPAARFLKVKSSAGAIHVEGAQQSNITYTIREHVRAGSEEAARREINRLKFSTGSGEIAWLRAECEGSNRGYIDFQIQVPAQTAMVRLETEGGAVTAKNISGKVDATTGGGGIELDQVGGAISVTSGGGDISIGKAGADVRAETGGGNVRIDSAAGQIVAKSGGGNLRIGSGKLMTLETGGGWITVAKCLGWIKAETGGGNIELNEVLGTAQIGTGGGSIKVGPISGGLRAETGSGPIFATLARGNATFVDSRLETSVGNIIVLVPRDLALTVRANVEVARGEGIHSDFGEIVVSHSGDVGPREAYAEGKLNGGGPILHVHTSTGSIMFKRAPM